MVFPVVGGNLLDTGYEISNSLRFNDGDSPALTRTMGAPTSTRKFTYVGWLKRSEINANQNSFLSWGGSTYATDLRYESGTDSLYFFFDDNAGWYAKTKARYRDVSAWYQVVLAVDTTQATESNRVKLYVNGAQYGPALDGTDWTQHEIFGQNYDFPELANGQTMAIGKRNSSGSHFFDGYMSEIYFIDGQALDSSYFGETNDNGVWIPKEYDGTYGNNGFLLQFKQTGTSQNSSGIGADTSGNDNHFAVSNLAAIDVTTDTPTNNFNTLNPLVPHNSIFDEETQGNTGLSSSGVQLRGGYMGSTIMPTSGKWYFEVKIVTITNSTDRTGIAIPRFDSVTGVDHIEGGDYAGLTLSTGATGRVFVTEGSSTTETDNSDYVFSNDDIAIFAVDTDASTPRVYVGKNGTWFTTSAGSGGNPATNTGYFEANLNTGGSGFSVGARHSAGASAAQSYLYNFGQPAYTISSGNSDANGYGNFEYAVPSGYYSICTKNLAEFG